MKSTTVEVNIALLPDVRLSAPRTDGRGAGARDPRVLLNEAAHRLDGRPLPEFDQRRTYDTYDGQGRATAADWYALAFPEPLTVNCIEMTMGLPYRDGGWWTSLAVEVRDAGEGEWRPVRGLTITPPYDVRDGWQGRRPYETYALLFEEARATAVRVGGAPGGLARFTSLARLAVYRRDRSRWNPAALPAPPTPDVFQLIWPATIWTLSSHLSKVIGLTVGLPLMEYYLDDGQREQWWRRLSHNYHGQPELWFLVGESIGWRNWGSVGAPDLNDAATAVTAPHVQRHFHDVLARAVAPIVVDGRALGALTTHPAVLSDGFDQGRHRRYAAEHGIAWPAYRAALARSPRLSLEQLEGTAGLMGMTASTIASLAQRLDAARAAADPARRARPDTVRRAIDVMEERLEEGVRVADVARAVDLKPPHFCRVFTAHTGQNPSDYLIALRIARAKDYLTHTALTVEDISARLGCDPSYFSRLFKRRTGYAPTSYALLMRAR